jgi:hypothetical protein
MPIYGKNVLEPLQNNLVSLLTRIMYTYQRTRISLFYVNRYPRIDKFAVFNLKKKERIKVFLGRMHEHKSSKKLCFEILQELAEPGRVKSSFQSAKNLVKVGHQSLDQVRSKKASTMHQ